jgi:hypothetical protein
MQNDTSPLQAVHRVTIARRWARYLHQVLTRQEPTHLSAAIATAQPLTWAPQVRLFVTASWQIELARLTLGTGSPAFDPFTSAYLVAETLTEHTGLPAAPVPPVGQHIGQSPDTQIYEASAASHGSRIMVKMVPSGAQGVVPWFPDEPIELRVRLPRAIGPGLFAPAENRFVASLLALTDAHEVHGEFRPDDHAATVSPTVDEHPPSHSVTMRGRVRAWSAATGIALALPPTCRIHSRPPFEATWVSSPPRIALRFDPVTEAEPDPVGGVGASEPA